jgi:hypothetical protein
MGMEAEMAAAVVTGVTAAVAAMVGMETEGDVRFRNLSQALTCTAPSEPRPRGIGGSGIRDCTCETTYGK